VFGNQRQSNNTPMRVGWCGLAGGVLAWEKGGGEIS